MRQSLDRFRGEIRQVPPAASAIHIDGERAYKRFRRGEEVFVGWHDTSALVLTS